MIKRRDYYFFEIFRAFLHPFVFIIVALLFAAFDLYYGGNIDWKIYFNYAIIGLITTVIVFIIAHLVFVNKKGRRMF